MLYALKAEEEEKLFQRWIAGPQMFVGFEEFKRQLRPPEFKREKDVIADAEKIMDAVAGGKTNGTI